MKTLYFNMLKTSIFYFTMVCHMSEKNCLLKKEPLQNGDILLHEY